jgi:glyoxylase-like metal-dependent hydrolase (beta-lactamase superfamily II)
LQAASAGAADTAKRGNMHEQLAHGITCIDTGYIRPGLAACYLVVDNGEVAIIETGTTPGVPRVLATLEALGLAPQQVRYIMPTHVHLDHAGAAGVLMQHCPQASLVVHPRGARHMIDPARLIAGAQQVYGSARVAELYGAIVPVAAERVCEAADGSSWPLGSRDLLVRDTPGHARHHFCIWEERSRGWFSGDTFGIAYRELYCDDKPFLLPTTTPVQFEPDALLASIELLMSHAPECFYLTHFGRIKASRELADLLELQIAGYTQIASAHGCNDEDEADMAQALGEYTLTLLRQRGCTLPEPQLREFLTMDMGLNAQGLMTWKRGRA